MKKTSLIFMMLFTAATLLFHTTSAQTEIPIDFVHIKGGTFMMGSPSDEVKRQDDETQHRVTVRDFYISKFQITQKEYEAVMGKNPSLNWEKGAYWPVKGVDWYEAIEYCNKRSIKEGLTPAYTLDKKKRDPNNKSTVDNAKWVVAWNRNANGYRLPTEAEWEYACRVLNPGSIIITDPYNMSGEGEWCWDWYGEYSISDQMDPVGAISSESRVFRGGPWSRVSTDDVDGFRPANRGGDCPRCTGLRLSLRLVRPTFD